MDKDLDELISRYTDELISLKNQWRDSGITTEEAKPYTAEETTNDIQNEERAMYEDTVISPEQTSETTSPASELPLANPENFALFTAKVYSGNQAYAVPNAKISIYLDGKLHAFLITDENGTTKQIKLQSYPETNSFIPENTQQVLDYYADVYADGFIERKALLVSAVGGSDILLSTELTPVSERID
jgi:hypothetical protein